MPPPASSPHRRQPPQSGPAPRGIPTLLGSFHVLPAPLGRQDRLGKERRCAVSTALLGARASPTPSPGPPPARPRTRPPTAPPAHLLGLGLGRARALLAQHRDRVPVALRHRSDPARAAPAAGHRPVPASRGAAARRPLIGRGARPSGKTIAHRWTQEREQRAEPRFLHGLLA